MPDRRRTSSQTQGLLLALVGSVLVLPPTAATAHEAVGKVRTCQGEKATIVGSGRPHSKVQGTPRRDVIVSNGAQFVFGKGGNDLICLTRIDDRRKDGVAYVDGGGGNDEIRVEFKATRTVWATLGAGNDSYSGGAGTDVVRTGTGEFGASYGAGDSDRGSDYVVTRQGSDTVLTGGAASSHDRIGLGPGPDRISVRGKAGTVQVGGSFGRDTLQYGAPFAVGFGDLVIDNALGTGTRDGEDWLDMSHIDAFEITTFSSLDFTGGEDDEYLDVAGPATVSAYLAGGDDTVLVRDQSGGKPRDFDGGTGVNRLLVSYEAADTTVDLVLGTITSTPATDPVTVSGFSYLDVSGAAAVTVLGTNGDEQLTAASCDTTIEGRGGDDVLIAGPLEGTACNDEAVEGPATVLGGSGDDVIIGGRVDDDLDGGPDTDTVDGRMGVDICLGETVSNCEG